MAYSSHTHVIRISSAYAELLRMPALTKPLAQVRWCPVKPGAIYVSSYYYVCVLVLLHLCSHATVYVISGGRMPSKALALRMTCALALRMQS
jgi:hypothetical protein